MKQQQVIFQEASNILGHRLIRVGRQFRYVVLRNSGISGGGNSCSALAWFTAHPLSLSKLALFLIDALRNTKRGDRPLVIAAHQSLSNTFIVVATINSNSGIIDNNGILMADGQYRSSPPSSKDASNPKKYLFISYIIVDLDWHLEKLPRG